MRSHRIAGLIMLGLALTMTGTVSTGAEAAGPPAAVGKLAPGMTGTVLQDTLETEDAAEWLRLDLVPGTYVAGRLAAAGPVRLDLVSEDGGHLRRLAGAGGMRDDFYFLVPEGGTYLRASASPEGSGSAVGYSVEILRNLLPETGTPGSPERSELLSPRLRQLAATLEAGGGTEAFWAQAVEAGTPLVEGSSDGTSIVTFLYRGAATGVRILGAPSADHDPMLRLGSSDVWYRSYELPNDTRLSYRLAPDVPTVPGSFWERRVAILATAQADPLNRHPWPANAVDRFNAKSVLSLNDAPPQPYVAPRMDAGGTVRHMTFASEALGNSRRISVYLPADFNPVDPDTVLLVHFDGEAYQSEVSVPRILDNMQADGVLPQTVAVLIGNPDMATRGRELPGSAAFAKAVARDVLEFALKDLGLAVPADRTVIAGSSFGGLAAVRLALSHPDVFGNVVSMSGSFWWSPKGTAPDRAEYMASRIAAADKAEVRFFLSAGLFETARDGDLDILNTNRHLRTVLKAKGYDVTLREYAGAHDYLVWQGALSDGLLALFGRPAKEH